jgi:hypothetical protein
VLTGRGGTRVAIVAVGLLAGVPSSASGADGKPAWAQLRADQAQCEDRTYPECRRVRFVYGPLTITPGNNAQVVGPVTVEKPLEDVYVTRFRPDMVRGDGRAPPSDEVMLHHATWLNIARYGGVPFAGAGEEKTIMEPRPGYGYRVSPSDTWQINYMLHNATSRAETVWIVYDLDLVPRQAGDRRGIRNVVPLWLDVLRDSDRPTYPVFNVQQGFGRVNPRTGRRECAFPRERCAGYDPYGRAQPGNGRGWDFRIPDGMAGTIVGMAGHLHPGGLRDEVSVVRGSGRAERARRIFDSEAVYFDRRGPVSWDMSMTVTKPPWKVRVNGGDRIRLNAVYDSQYGSWYEGMGIVMAWIAPGDRSGVDPFSTVRVRERVPPRSYRRRAKQGCRLGYLRRAGRCVEAASYRRPAARRCRSGYRARGTRCLRRIRYRWVNRPAPIQTTGGVTHGQLPENTHYGGDNVRPLTTRPGALVSDIGIGGFRYSAGDLSSVDQDGIPQVRAGANLSFHNFDAAAGIWHTVTTCRGPCTGVTGVSYPLANDPVNLDSLVLGYAPPGIAQPAINRGTFTFRPSAAGLQTGATYTYFCRVHPFMRGAFKVVP